MIPITTNLGSGGGSGGNASVGVTGVAAPASATEIGVIDNGGELQGASASNPVRVDPTGTTVQPVSGTITALDYVPTTINSTGQVTITSTATNIIAQNTARQGVVITNSSATITVYVGTSGVTSSTGLPLTPGQAITLPTTAAVYAIASSTSGTVGYLELD